MGSFKGVLRVLVLFFSKALEGLCEGLREVFFCGRGFRVLREVPRA